VSDSLRTLSEEGVAVWLDDMSRDRLRTGNLAGLVRDRHVVGVTTNPTIFQKALTQGDAYTEQVHDLALRGVDVGEALRAITTYDVRWACDVLRPVYDQTDGRDGRVSIEVDPRIAHETERTVAEARALWWLVDRPNLFVKIPATLAGLPAISQCLSEGISVNVTLIFSLERYEAVLAAFLDGMERAREAGLDLSRIGSVASFFVSRVDTEVDKRLDKIGSEDARALRGAAAIANARLAYQRYEKVFASLRWQALADAGAAPQRPLWASTGVKDPEYDDTRYVVELVAPGTVNTMPEATLEAMADHGEVRGDTVRGAYADAQAVLDRLAELGVDYDDVVQILEDEGVEKFETSWTDLIESTSAELERQGAQVSTGGVTSPAGSGPAAAGRPETAR
jgi:transaldolase